MRIEEIFIFIEIFYNFIIRLKKIGSPIPVITIFFFEIVRTIIE